MTAAGLNDFDASVATGSSRVLTQAIGLWAAERGYRGIHHLCRHAPSLSCWAIFAGTPIEIADLGSQIPVDDPDLLAMSRHWNLVLPG